MTRINREMVQIFFALFPSSISQSKAVILWLLLSLGLAQTATSLMWNLCIAFRLDYNLIRVILQCNQQPLQPTSNHNHANFGASLRWKNCD